MPDGKRELQHLTWKDCKQIFETDPVILLPLGSMEVQGPHSIVGDYLIASEVARETARRSDAYVIPVIPFGCSEYFREFPGTISLSPMTLYGLLHDVIECLIEHGATKLLLVNGHGGNNGTLEWIGRDIRREFGVIMGKITIWRSFTKELLTEVYGEKAVNNKHGGGMVDAVVRYLFPDDIRADYVGPSDINQQWEAFTLTDIGETLIGGTIQDIYTDMTHVSKQGCLGDPLMSTAEDGKVLFEAMVACCCEFVDKMKRSDMRLH
ncbi:MAG: creatininase family protein [Synergistaceae bacterium]|jgi:creatinine amidohydrolase|nr:creatininase family protein [Synergistaceae bacterium]